MGNRAFTALSIARKGLLLVAIPLVAQVVFGIALLAVSRKAVDAHSWELHSQQVLTETYEIKTSLLIAQGSLRAYVLTQNAGFLSDCREAERRIPVVLAHLYRLVTDNPAQRERVRQMANAGGKVLDFQNVNAALVQSGHRGDAAALIGTQRGRQLMEAFLVPADAVLAEEHRLAAQRHADAAASNRETITVVLIGFALNVLLAAALAVAFTTGIARRLGILADNAQRLATGRVGCRGGQVES